MVETTTAIKANELRIGNVLRAKQEIGWYPSGIIKVEAITNDGVNLSQGDSAVYEWDNLKAIPLTSEIIKKCGLIRHISDDKVMEHYFVRRQKGMDTYCLLSRVVGRDEFYLEHYRATGKKVVVQSVHELQNLYFVLSGKELQINF